MLTTLPNRVSALLADPFYSTIRNLDGLSHRTDADNHARLERTVPLSIWEDDQAFYVDADVPGIALEDLDVSLEKGTLTIRCERKPTRELPNRYDERFYGRFQRTVALNEWVDPNGIQAVLEDGELHLKIAKRAESRRQRVTISHATNGSAPRVETEEP